MNIIVIGCGKIGETLIRSFVKEGHDVVALDNRDTVIQDLTNKYDVMCLCGNGADCLTLQEAGVEKAEMVVAVTGSDEVNMLACFLARRLGAAHTIARIRNPEYNDRSLGFLKEQLGLSMAINPELLAAQDLFHSLKLPAGVKVEYFSRRNFEMIEVKLKEDSVLCGTSLMELRNKHDAKFLVCVVQRGNEVIIPDGSFRLQAGDKIGLTAKPTEMQKLFRSMKLTNKLAKDVMILGGSKTAFYLAKMLIGSGTNVKLIDVDRHVCRNFCDALPALSAVHGDGTQQDLLLEEGLTDQDAFVALTGMDEENILMSFFASSQNVPKVVAKVNREEMASLSERLGLERIISPKEIIANVLLRYARALQSSMGSSIETLYQVMDGKAEALEFAVNGSSSLTGIPLKDLQLKKNILIAGIIRDRKTIIPTGTDQILSGDKVVVISASHRLAALADILK